MQLVGRVSLPSESAPGRYSGQRGNAEITGGCDAGESSRRLFMPADTVNHFARALTNAESSKGGA